jgi:hypothetical protein
MRRARHALCECTGIFSKGGPRPPLQTHAVVAAPAAVLSSVAQYTDTEDPEAP